jgi:hypothetical protein
MLFYLTLPGLTLSGLGLVHMRIQLLTLMLASSIFMLIAEPQPSAFPVSCTQREVVDQDRSPDICMTQSKHRVPPTGLAPDPDLMR